MGNDLTSSTAAIVSGGTAAAVSTIALLCVRWLISKHDARQEEVLKRLKHIEKMIHDMNEDSKDDRK